MLLLTIRSSNAFQQQGQEITIELEGLFTGNLLCHSCWLSFNLVHFLGHFWKKGPWPISHRKVWSMTLTVRHILGLHFLMIQDPVGRRIGVNKLCFLSVVLHCIRYVMHLTYNGTKAPVKLAYVRHDCIVKESTKDYYGLIAKKPHFQDVQR